jgi:hypothetical protein
MLPAWVHSHPLHLSVTNITLENGKLKVQMKTFRDDWETAFFHYHSRVIDLTDEKERAGPWFGEYLEERFHVSLSAGGERLSLEIDSITLDEDAMSIEMHGEMTSEANSLYIYNALLTDIFPDQTNLVIFGFKNRETGIKFDVKKHNAEVTLREN